jgi:hypothetical protein
VSIQILLGDKYNKGHLGMYSRQRCHINTDESKVPDKMREKDMENYMSKSIIPSGDFWSAAPLLSPILDFLIS